MIINIIIDTKNTDSAGQLYERGAGDVWAGEAACPGPHSTAENRERHPPNFPPQNHNCGSVLYRDWIPKNCACSILSNVCGVL